MAEEESLLERILDREEKPADLSLELLQKITNRFSEERKIGQGGFGAVYKGLFRERIVAVKRIYVNLEKIDIDDKLYDREFNNLWKINHENVVRFLGFCSNTCKKRIENNGSVILADVRERLFRFEYISGGSLDKHITDELRGLEWNTRYEIITGICKGLCYLHGKKIVHMDLKPANILIDIDNHMVPKITDFGLSRSNTNSHTVAQPIGTLGYIAPEYREGGKTTEACDIYSLGGIIMELVTGGMEVPIKHNVLRRWRHRWNNPPTPLQYQQVTGCVDIAVRCREQDPKARPSIKKIIDLLSENTDGHTGQEICCYMDDDMLGIEPLELHFTSELNKEMSWSVKLTNKTKTCFAFNIERPSQQYTIQPDKGIVPPECNDYLVQITLQPQERTPQVTQNADTFIVHSRTVSNGHRVEDITEHIFHERSGKVVDEVNLMVVYEPTKLSSSEKTEAASPDINSSTRGQCVIHTERCNLHSLQSFSRYYPTRVKYLGKESDRAVDLARGAMGSLLDKLGKLVTEDYNLKKSIKSDIESFSEDLAIIHQDLPKLENVDDARIWVHEVRELSYHIEDMVDSFLVHVEPDSNRSGYRELTHEGLNLLVNGMPTHDQIDDVIKDIKNLVQDVASRKQKYKFNVNNVVANATPEGAIDPRISSIYIDREQIIGIEEQINKLTRLFEEDGDVSKLKIVSIVGFGGLGKTTLAKAVYDKLAVYDKMKTYRRKAFVTVGQNPVLKTVLKKIIIGFTSQRYNAARLEYLDEQQLIGELQKLLNNKRYFIVIDDIWDCMLWDTINSAFPRGNGSRVVTTTRIQEVVDRERPKAVNKVYYMKPLSDEDSRRLFYTRTFGDGEDCPPRKEEISKYILKRCGGMPLAIISIARHLARDATDSTWQYVRESLSVIKGNDIERMKQILDLSYIHLPDHLKTCLLHICMYPEDCEIDKNDLLRQWVAEGFVSTDGGHDAEHVAEEYFKALIDRFMIQPGKIDYYNNEVMSCKVHDIILDLMRSKSREVNFFNVIDGSKDEAETRGNIRRVSVHSNDEEDMGILETMKNKDPVKHVRSVLLYRGSLVRYFLGFNYVRVLHLEYKGFSHGLIDVSGISRLFLLRYLKIANTAKTYGDLKLPGHFGELQQLETIDIQRCILIDPYGRILHEYPSGVDTLPRLSDLRYCASYGLALPNGIGRMKSLRTLAGVCVFRSSVDTIKGLGELTNLRNLEIHSMFLSKSIEKINVCMEVLQSSILRLHTSLRILTMWTVIIFEKLLDLRGWSRTIFPQGSRIRKLDLRGRNFHRCPEWIGQLHDLYSFRIQVTEVADGLSIVAGLPSLAYLCLFTGKLRVKQEESVLFPGSGSFPALKHLRFRYEKASLTFEEGALPKIEKLEILFRHHMTRRFLPVGIEHLPAGTLKKISLCVAKKIENTHKYFDDPRDILIKHKKELRLVLKRAFEVHHTGAGIIIHFENGIDDEEYDYVEDVWGVDNEEDSEEDEDDYGEDGDEDVYAEDTQCVDDVGDYEEEQDYEEDGDEQDKGAYQVNRSQSSAQVETNTGQVQLIVGQPFSSLDRAKPMASFPVDINNDLLVQQGNNAMLDTAVEQYLDLNQARPDGVGIAPPATSVQPRAEAVDDEPGQYAFWDNLMTDSDEGAEDKDDDGAGQDFFWDNLITDDEGEAAVGQA